MSSAQPSQSDSKTYASLLTAAGRAAVATIAIDGPLSATLVAGHFHSVTGRSLASSFPMNRILFGTWNSAREGTDTAAGEELVVCRRSQQLIEIHCHGGHAAAERILHDLTHGGCQRIDWRSYLASRTDDPLTFAAQTALAAARTQRVAAILLDQHRGALRSELQRVRSELARQPQEAHRRLELLAQRELLGRHLTQPWKIVLAGPANVGKSSLINALLGYQRAIVYDQPGTTRDILTATTALDGWPVQLSDTAGLRSSLDAIETEGVRRARAEVSQADGVALVFSYDQPWSDEHQALVEQFPRALIVHNKCDLARHDGDAGRRPAGLNTSSVTGERLPELAAALVAPLNELAPAAGAAVPFAEEQFRLLQAARNALAEGDPDRADELLSELVYGRRPTS